MLSSSVFDAPQTTLPCPPPSTRREPQWYELQTATQSLRTASEVHGSGGSFFTQSNTFEQIRSNRDVTGKLRTLRQLYMVLESDRRVIEVLEEQAGLFTLLIEAVGPLRMAFGEKRLLQVRVQYSDDDRLLKVAVQLPADFGSDPEGALRSFDRKWWLQNCHRSGGVLVFDYEIQDAI
jgi:hypothetical protein